MGVEGIVGDVNEMAGHFLAQDINVVCKEGLWRLRSRNLFFGFLFLFGHGWVVVVAHEVTA
jgi:hypothetical protein